MSVRTRKNRGCAISSKYRRLSLGSRETQEAERHLERTYLLPRLEVWCRVLRCPSADIRLQQVWTVPAAQLPCSFRLVVKRRPKRNYAFNLRSRTVSAGIRVSFLAACLVWGQKRHSNGDPSALTGTQHKSSLDT